MKSLYVSGLLALVVLSSALLGSGSKSAPPTDDGQRVLVKLDHYTDDLHAAFMAIKLATGLADQGAEVTLFVNLEGVRAVDSGTPQDMRWGHTGPFSDHYGSFLKAGGHVLVCPHCAKAAGIEKGELRDGATIASEGEVVDLILAADKVLDY